MREIKFRFYSKHLGKFVAPDDSIFVGALKDPSMNPMQFTGLTDRNGTEIYEGDIVTNFARTNDMKLRSYQIYWNDVQARFSAKDHRAKSSTAIDDFSMNQCEVVGNIYENPELLTAKDN